ncbi:hypothetical protein HGRIS_006274 [Hohenbuehelia grisea]|uniref:Uncharacterized protein n=1 Tax=Hohenbuehelia grisea TaxID=104357 RepID=A0ABR3K288_9AGAR
MQFVQREYSLVTPIVLTQSIDNTIYFPRGTSPIDSMFHRTSQTCVAFHTATKASFTQVISVLLIPLSRIWGYVAWLPPHLMARFCSEGKPPGIIVAHQENS